MFTQGRQHQLDTIWICFTSVLKKSLQRRRRKMLLLLDIAAYLAIYCVALVSPQSNSWSAHTPKPPEDLLRLWIDRQQVKMFSGKETRKKDFIHLSLFSEPQSLLTILFPSVCCSLTRSQSRLQTLFLLLRLAQIIYNPLLLSDIYTCCVYATHVFIYLILRAH
jgi:hypothetical protein